MGKTDSAFGGLTGLRVLKNCPANWNRMTGTDQVRFCTHCTKKVYNLSGMDRQAAAALIDKSEGDLCVRYYVRPDGMVMTSDCPTAQMKRVKHFAAIGSILAAMGITLGFPVVAQGAIASPERSIRFELKQLRDTQADLKASTDPKDGEALFSLGEEIKQRISANIERMRTEDKWPHDSSYPLGLLV